jgi:dephospho-CoA kinase
MLIGLTGRAGSGKSYVRLLVSHFEGLNWCDCDVLGHEILEQDDIKIALIHEFGEAILDTRLSINRKVLGHIVFSDESKRKRLNKIVHPEIKRHIQEWVLKQTGLSVIEGALLEEIDLIPLCDEILVIDTDDMSIMKRSPKQYKISRLQNSRERYQEIGGTVIINTYDDCFKQACLSYFKKRLLLTRST